MSRTMAVATDAAGSGAPFAKSRGFGDTLVGVFAGSHHQQQRNFDTGEPEWKNTAPGEPRKPALEEVMYFVAMAAPGQAVPTTMVIGTDESGFSAIEDKSVVRFSVSGWKWNQAINAAKKLPAWRDFKQGQRVSGDVWMIRQVGFSAKVLNSALQQAYEQAGLPIAEGRVILRSPEQHRAWVDIQIARNQKTGAAKDFELYARRSADGEKVYEDAADAVALAKPWEKEPAVAEPKGFVDAPPVDSPGPGPDWANTPMSAEAQAMQEAARQATQPGPATVGSGDPWAQPSTPAPVAQPPASTQPDPWAAQTPVAAPPAPVVDPTAGLPPNSPPQF